MIDFWNMPPDQKISPHFTAGEIQVHSNPDGVKGLDDQLPFIMESVRLYAGNIPVRVNSVVRTTLGVEDSTHFEGMGVDLGLSRQQMDTLKNHLDDFLTSAKFLGLGGFGVYPWGVHVDTKQGKNAWRSSTGKVYIMRHWAHDGATEWLQPAFVPQAVGKVDLSIWIVIIFIIWFLNSKK